MLKFSTVPPDTIGTSKLVLLMEVSFVEGSFNIIKYQNGTRKVSLVVRCPLLWGVLYKGFHLIILINNGYQHVQWYIHTTHIHVHVHVDKFVYYWDNFFYLCYIMIVIYFFVTTESLEHLVKAILLHNPQIQVCNTGFIQYTVYLHCCM